MWDGLVTRRPEPRARRKAAALDLAQRQARTTVGSTSVLPPISVARTPRSSRHTSREAAKRQWLPAHLRWSRGSQRRLAARGSGSGKLGRAPDAQAESCAPLALVTPEGLQPHGLHRAVRAAPRIRSGTPLGPPCSPNTVLHHTQYRGPENAQTGLGRSGRGPTTAHSSTRSGSSPWLAVSRHQGSNPNRSTQAKTPRVNGSKVGQEAVGEGRAKPHPKTQPD
jgi:hypothetical protein